ncbi:hypothetical protein ACMGDH_17800 [Sphingomonas sp. DT-207]|uniref:hypothetical protein n=1 Tax=Sphingomonas sp. DT-207 TaxID=3396167 RepID=UPI003F1B53E6
MSDPRDLSGIWYGSYVADREDQANSFIAVLEETLGAVTGTITEPDDTGQADLRRASVAGQRGGPTLRFLKQYDGHGSWDHTVHYTGQVDEAGTEVAGRWIVEGVTGSFAMHREKFSAEELEAEEVTVEAGPVEFER